MFGQRRPEYYERKIALALDETQQLVTSRVIEVEGKVAGFIMGEVCWGEFGVPETTATIDTIGVDPVHQGRGVGATLFDEYASHLRKIGVQFITTRVNWTRQFTVEADRADEYVELYESLGNEVRVKPVTPDLQVADECATCLLAACDRYVIIYTRPRE